MDLEFEDVPDKIDFLNKLDIINQKLDVITKLNNNLQTNLDLKISLIEKIQEDIRQLSQSVNQLNQNISDLKIHLENQQLNLSNEIHEKSQLIHDLSQSIYDLNRIVEQLQNPNRPDEVINTRNQSFAESHPIDNNDAYSDDSMSESEIISQNYQRIFKSIGIPFDSTNEIKDFFKKDDNYKFRKHYLKLFLSNRDFPNGNCQKLTKSLIENLFTKDYITKAYWPEVQNTNFNICKRKTIEFIPKYLSKFVLKFYSKQFHNQEWFHLEDFNKFILKRFNVIRQEVRKNKLKNHKNFFKLNLSFFAIE